MSNASILKHTHLHYVLICRPVTPKFVRSLTQKESSLQFLRPFQLQQVCTETAYSWFQEYFAFSFPLLIDLSPHEKKIAVSLLSWFKEKQTASQAEINWGVTHFKMQKTLNVLVALLYSRVNLTICCVCGRDWPPFVSDKSNCGDQMKFKQGKMWATNLQAAHSLRTNQQASTRHLFLFKGDENFTA